MAINISPETENALLFIDVTPLEQAFPIKDKIKRQAGQMTQT
jgi:hypothetical protein